MEWLNDIGSGLIPAQKPPFFGKDLRLISCFTAVRSPDSEGMPEAFVQTFEQDFGYFHQPPMQKRIAQLEQWFQHYYEYRPHKRLKVKTPKQLIHSTL